jgi:glutamyl-tRNA reductase
MPDQGYETTLACAGINHRLAPVEVRERFAIAPHRLEEILGSLISSEGISGAVAVSTCNRVEIYASGPDPLPAAVSVLRGISGGLDVPFATNTPAQTAAHMFRVASGLESMVPGETEILGQLKKSYAAACAAGAADAPINFLFQSAFRAAKEIRTRTGIGRGAASVGSVAADLATQLFEGLEGRKVVVLGAGETGELVARRLVARGASTVIVANRAFARAEAISRSIGGRAVRFEDWQSSIGGADIMVCCTAAPHHVVTVEKLEPLLRAGGNRPFFLIDLAVPRDIDPEVATLPNVHLCDIDSLERMARESLGAREAEGAVCAELLERHVAAFQSRMEIRSAAAV